MPDVKISALPASTTPLAGTEVLPIVQSATTKQVSVANLTAGRSVGGTNFIPSGSSVPTNGLYLPAANTLGFSTNSTEQMRITDTGIVGINNNSPTAVNGRPSTLFVGTNNSGSAAELVLGHQGDGFSLFTSGGSGTGTLTFATATTGLMTLSVTGNLGIGVTPACILDISGASGGQIKFPATQNASANVNTLDDYEEGTFTPTIIGNTTAGTGTYTTQVGSYTKVGQAVSIQIRLSWTAHTGTGSMFVSGLPFTTLSGGVQPSFTVGDARDIALTASNILTLFSDANTTLIQFIQTPVGGGASLNVPIDTSATIILAGTYIV